MKILFLATLLLVPAAYAQERTATGPLQTEASWAALKNLTEQANTNAQAAHIRLNQIETCAKEQKLYSPSTTGADEHGCIASASTKCSLKNITSTSGKCPAGSIFSGADTNTTTQIPGSSKGHTVTKTTTYTYCMAISCE